MNKEEFLKTLERLLKSLKRDERKRFISYYSEMIDDYVEDGCTEEDAVKRIGGPGEIAQEILSGQEMAEYKPVSLGMKILIIVLLILGCPIWGSLAVAGLCLAFAGLLVILSGYLVIWCIPLVTGALSVSSIILAVVSMTGSAVLMFDNAAAGLMQMGSGIFFAGLSIFAGILTWELGKVFIRVTARFTRWLCSLTGRGKRGVLA